MNQILKVPAGTTLPGNSDDVFLDLPQSMTFEEFLEAGKWLGMVERSASWWVGDWWAFGQERYPDVSLKTLVEHPSWAGPKYDVCKHAAWCSLRFRDKGRRRPSLQFSHHLEAAVLPPEMADSVLEKAESFGWTVKQLRIEVNKIRVRFGEVPDSSRETVTELQELIDRGLKFGTIYADPPWLYDNQGTRAATSNHYEGMTVSELCELPIRQLAADDSHLHLWTTNAFLFEAPKIFSAWGFEFRSTFVWAKPQMGIGNYWRNSHEFMLTAIRGDAKRFNDRSLMSWGIFDRSRHSTKPGQVRNYIERASPGPYLELFAREEFNGWTTWGNEVERTLEV